MKKVLVPALILMSVSSAAMAQADTRSAWAKSQDMYVEPTLRMKQTQTYTPVDANNVAGQTVITNETVQVYGPSGEVKSQTSTGTQAPVAPVAPVAPAVQAPAVQAPAVQAPAAPAVQPLQPQIQDLSRPMQ